MRNWDSDGWTDFDWEKIGNVTGDLNRVAADLDADYGGGGCGCSPKDIEAHIEVIENALRRLREVRDNYL